MQHLISVQSHLPQHPMDESCGNEFEYQQPWQTAVQLVCSHQNEDGPFPTQRVPNPFAHDAHRVAVSAPPPKEKRQKRRPLDFPSILR